MIMKDFSKYIIVLFLFPLHVFNFVNASLELAEERDSILLQIKELQNAYKELKDESSTKIDELKQLLLQNQDEINQGLLYTWT